jgi:chitin disaccharide deacetylase
MGVLFARPELFAVYVKVAHEYKLPFLAVHAANAPSGMLSLLSEKDILVDSVTGASPGVAPADWSKFYTDTISNLKPGLTEIIVHLGHDDAEMQAITVDHPDYGSAWRQRDYNVITSVEFKKAIEENHIVLVHWKDLRRLVE